MNIRKKLILLFLSISLIPIFVLTVVNFVTDRNVLTKIIKNNFEEIAKSKAHTIEFLVLEGIKEAKILASHPHLKTAVLDDILAKAGNPEQDIFDNIKKIDREWITQRNEYPEAQRILSNPLSGFLKGYQQKNPEQYGELFVTGLYGNTVGMTKVLSDFNQADEQWWKKAYGEGKGSVFLDDRGFDESVKAIVLGVVVPILDSGRVVGILKINFKLTGILHILNDHNFKEIDKIFLARSQGTIIFGSNITGEKEVSPTELRTLNDGKAGAIEAVHKGKKTFAGFAPVEALISTRIPSPGEEKGISGEKWVPTTWFLFVETFQENALGTINDLLFTVLIVGALLAAVVLMAAISTARSISEPIMALQAGTKVIAEGDLDYKVGSESPDEVGELSRAFDHMTANLKRSLATRDELNAVIEEQKSTERSLMESEERFRNVINNSPMFITLKDAEGPLKLVNQEHATLFGSVPQNIEGKYVSEVAPKKVAEDSLAQDRKVIETKTVVVEERPIITSKGNFDYLVTKFPILDESGAVKEIGTIGVDISTLKQAERALKTSEARLAGILDIAPEAVIAIGEDMNIRLFNQGAERIFGYSAEEVMDKPLDMLMPERSRKPHAKHVKAFDSSDDIHLLMNERMEISGLRKDGTEFPASASVSKLEIDGKKIFTVLLQDITQRKQAEEAVILSKTEAEYANYAKTQFLANMSHELRTPLNSIIGFSQILMGQGMGKLDISQTNDYASNINDSANHLLAVIQDLLDVSKIEAGELDLEKETIDFDKLIRDCITMVKERADNKSVYLSYKAAESTSSIKADKLRLKQILLNLLSNAIKFTPDGGEVEVALEASGDKAVLIKISDTGIGIKKADIPKILQPFGQVKDIMHRNHEGTGLGLSLAKSLTELHGGNLVITSEVGKGTTITVELPNGLA